MKHNCHTRAQLAYASAEAASDPRDKAAFRSAAEMWARLARPRTVETFSLKPYRRQLADLQARCQEALDCAITVQPVSRARLSSADLRVAQTIEF